MRPLMLLLFLCSASAFAGEIALTFDDAPRYDTTHFSGSERSALLLEKLKKVNVPQVAFFVNSVKLQRHKGVERIASFAAAGHLIGNHTHSHKWIHKVGADAYIEDIRSAHLKLKDHANFRPWFRYPFLDQGKDRADQLKIHAALKQLGYAHGYVTVDNYDWYMDRLLQAGLEAGKTVDMDALGKAYVALLWRAIQFYDKLAIDSLGRSPKHVLLLHENDLAALFIDDLVTFLRQQGWSIISPTEAYTDPIASQFPTGRCRQGRLACLASESGYKGHTGDDAEDEAFLEAYFTEHKIMK